MPHSLPHSLPQAFARLTPLAARTPEHALTDEGHDAFACLSPFGSGGMYVGRYSGCSEWERHGAGDEMVQVWAGHVTLVLWQDGLASHRPMGPGYVMVVPQGMWHRFIDAVDLHVITLTPQPTEHALSLPGA